MTPQFWGSCDAVADERSGCWGVTNCGRPAWPACTWPLQRPIP
jgi:hypothetical protein